MDDATHTMKVGKQEVDVPNWAEYVAQDEDRQWAFFSDCPRKRHPALFRGYWSVFGGGMCQNLHRGHKPKDWTKELYLIDREK